MRVTAVAALLALIFAGCSEPAAPGAPVDFVPPGEVELEAGTGAIAGLVVDDRFRPIAAHVLLMQTGDTATTTINGEFSFIDLEPGTYTLRVTAENHEAKSATVQVLEGEFAEASIIARRTADVGSFIYTQEFTVFQFCSLNAVLVLTDFCNLADLSGDSGRASINVDFTATENITYIVTEFLADNEGDYDIWIGYGMADLTGPTFYFAHKYINGDYQKCAKQVGAIAACNDRGLASEFRTDLPLEYVLWVNGMLDDETGGPTFGLSTGIGGQLAFKGRFMLSAFVGEPEESVDDYCLLC